MADIDRLQAIKDIAEFVEAIRSAEKRAAGKVADK
jgi:hypothetical protein